MIVESKFKAAFWLRNPHLQTIWASKARRTDQPDACFERLELPDGDFIDALFSQSLKWQSKERQSENKHSKNTPEQNIPGRKGIVCLFHGLGGSIRSAYAAATFTALEQAGFDVAFMHFRGCSGEPNRLSKAYHSGQTEDIRFFIKTLATRFPKTPLYACAFSLGANAMLKFLGEEAGDCLLSGAVAVAPPLVLKEGADKLNKGFARVYQRYLLDEMKRQLEKKREKHSELDLPSGVSELDSFWQFDDVVTAKLHGFSDVHDYYEQSSSRQYLGSIECPTHIIHSRDDPFFTPAVIPGENELAKAVTLEISARGGHVGFVSGNNPFKPGYWLDLRIPELLLDMLRRDVPVEPAHHD